MHLVIRLVRPQHTKPKYELKDHQQEYLKDVQPTRNIIEGEINYSKISSKIYKEVLKRRSLWKIRQTEQFQDTDLNKFVKFIDSTLCFLSVRENQKLFKCMNEFYSVI